MEKNSAWLSHVSRSSAIALILSGFATLNVEADYQVKSLTDCKVLWGPSTWARNQLCDSTDWFFESIPLRRMSAKALKADIVFYTSLIEKPDSQATSEEQNEDMALDILLVLLDYALLGDHTGVNGTALKIKNELCPKDYFKNAFPKGLCENIDQVALHPTDFIEDLQCQSLYIVHEDVQRSMIVRKSDLRKIDKKIKKNPNFLNDQKSIRSKYVEACPLRKSIKETKGNQNSGAATGAARGNRSSDAR